MPTLDWIGKNKVINHHQEVPYRILERQYSFDENGQHAEDNGSPNMIIHGDNLEALKSLLPRYEGRIKCIYIDPPYNTGNEGWVYNDNVNDPKIRKWLGEVVGKEGEDLSRHDKWLCMMYPRLMLLYKLLAEDGCLAISISYHELHNLVSICKEIFSTRQVVTVTVQTSGGKPNGGFNYVQEYIVFVVPQDFVPNASEAAMNSYASPYHGMNLATFNQVQRPNQAYPIYVERKTGRLVGVGKSLQERIDEGSYTGEKKDFTFDAELAPDGCIPVWPITAKGDPCVWRLISSRLLRDWEKGFIKIVPQNGKKAKHQAFAIQYLSEGIIEKIESGELQTYKYSEDVNIPTLEVKDFKTGGVSISTVWQNTDFYTVQGSNEITEIFGTKAAFQYPKPSRLVQEVFERIATEDCIILDSFAGSGTSGHAVLRLNAAKGKKHNFILIEMGDHSETVTSERIKRVIQGYGKEDKKVPGTGGNFSFYELGAPLLTPEGYLNEAVGVERIREYMWYMETRSDLPKEGNGNPHYLGTSNSTSYYFYYQPGESTALDYDFLETIPERTESIVIYADRCHLSEKELTRFGITFKKIPRDITKL